jgi:6-phosphogluconate dehydrogenase (decarboxylating)
MKLGMIGFGRMGANMVRRLLRAGHVCVVYDIHLEANGAGHCVNMVHNGIAMRYQFGGYLEKADEPKEGHG